MRRCDGLEMREGHPEVFFKAIAPELVKQSERTAKGKELRKKVLSRFGELPDLEQLPGSTDDKPDEMVLSLGVELELETLPESAEENIKGEKMRILRPRP